MKIEETVWMQWNITGKANLPLLGATKHLYNWLCPSVGLLVCLLVG